jgi:hypothetical protein
MQTHELSTAHSAQSMAPISQTYGQTLLKKLQFDDKNPYWVVTATPDVVNGHNGIWLPAFADFVRGLLTQHVHHANMQRTAKRAADQERKS